ncbi:hypothetical protein ABT187_36555 [Streptomyces sp. NPDC001817]|uniref:hypothetical protein n=1 Tax=Streptomyces sp. NPDC001817 TaxID=3154398 RepID=UPI003320C538
MEKLKALAVTAATVAALGVGTGAANASTAQPAADRCQSVHTYRTGNEYMEVHGWGGKGAVVDTWEYASQDGHIQNNERWCLEHASEGGWYLHPYYNPDLCLDVPSTNEVVVWSCNGHSNQRFSFSNGVPTGGQITPRSNTGLRIDGWSHEQLWATPWNNTDITFWL